MAVRIFTGGAGAQFVGVLDLFGFKFSAKEDFDVMAKVGEAAQPLPTQRSRARQ